MVDDIDIDDASLRQILRTIRDLETLPSHIVYQHPDTQQTYTAAVFSHWYNMKNRRYKRTQNSKKRKKSETQRSTRSQSQSKRAKKK